MKPNGRGVEGWFVLVLGAWAGGCSATSTETATGSVETAGAAGEAGSSEAAPTARSLPGYLVDTCDALGIELDPSLSVNDCPTIACDCPGFTSLQFSPPQGCVVGIDCSVACEQGDYGLWMSCALNGCKGDDDCTTPNDKCFMPPGYDHGQCGQRGRVCLDDGDCAAGSSCVVIEQDGTRSCVLTERGSACNDDRQCASGARCALPLDGLLGACSGGERGDECFTDRDCRGGLYCGTGYCADGSHDSGCRTDEQCASGACRKETCVDGRDGDFCDSDQDCGSGICVLDIVCASGEVDAPCEHDTDCASGLCAADNYDSACTAGEAGSKCLDDGDCRAGTCVHDHERAPGRHFGSCG